MDVTLPNGAVIEGVPDDATKDQIMQKAIAGGLATAEDFGQSTAPQQQPQQEDQYQPAYSPSFQTYEQMQADKEAVEAAKKRSAWRIYIARA